MRPSPLIAVTLLLCGASLAEAACTQADARARMDTINQLAAGFRRGSPDYERLAAIIVPIMQESQVTESTCTRLDAAIAQLRR